MKKVLFIILFVAAFTNVKSQTWCPPGATWYYEHFTWDPWLGGNISYLKYEYKADTIINGINCKKVDKYHQTLFTQSIYTYADNDRVYMLRDSIFYPVYDFTASVGDTMIIPGGIDITYNGFCNNPFGAAKIDSSGTMIINGESLRYICVSPTPTSQWGIHGKIIEKVGPSKGVLASFEPTMVSYALCGVICPSPPVISLRCYSDDNFPLYTLGLVACDYISSVSEYNNSNFIFLSPNPSNNFINVNYKKSIVPEYYQIMDITGKIIVSDNITENTFIINTEKFQNGVYVLCLTDRNKNVSTKRFSVVK